MSLVADISVVLAWLFEEKQTPQALDVLRLIEAQGVLVSPLWWYELENGILVDERRARKTESESAAFLKLVCALPIQTDDAPPHGVSDAIVALARQNQLTAYDAAYVELAARRGVALATFDDAIRRCAPKLGVKVLPVLR